MIQYFSICMICLQKYTTKQSHHTSSIDIHHTNNLHSHYQVFPTIVQTTYIAIIRFSPTIIQTTYIAIIRCSSDRVVTVKPYQWTWLLTTNSSTLETNRTTSVMFVGRVGRSLKSCPLVGWEPSNSANLFGTVHYSKTSASHLFS